jgi:hypothetical protein
MERPTRTERQPIAAPKDRKRSGYITWWRGPNEAQARLVQCSGVWWWNLGHAAGPQRRPRRTASRKHPFKNPYRP